MYVSISFCLFVCLPISLSYLSLFNLFADLTISFQIPSPTTQEGKLSAVAANLAAKPTSQTDNEVKSGCVGMFSAPLFFSSSVEQKGRDKEEQESAGITNNVFGSAVGGGDDDGEEEKRGSTRMNVGEMLEV